MEPDKEDDDEEDEEEGLDGDENLVDVGDYEGEGQVIFAMMQLAVEQESTATNINAQSSQGSKYILHQNNNSPT